MEKVQSNPEMFDFEIQYSDDDGMMYMSLKEAVASVCLVLNSSSNVYSSESLDCCDILPVCHSQSSDIIAVVVSGPWMKQVEMLCEQLVKDFPDLLHLAPIDDITEKEIEGEGQLFY